MRELEREFDDLPIVTQKAMVNALNKVGRLANKAIAKFIKDNYNIPAKSLKIGYLVKLIRADARKASDTGRAWRAFFTIVIRKRAINLIMYGGEQIIGGGVSVRVKRTTKVIRRAFVSVWKSGSHKRFIFVRDPKLGTFMSKYGKRTKRRALYGPSIADLYGSIRARKIIDDTIEKNFQPMLDKEFERQFERRR
jgi:hypothetical protein